MTAADVGDFAAGFQLSFDSAERGDPFGDQISGVARTEEALGANKQIGVVLTPEHTATMFKRIADALARLRHGFQNVKAAADKKRTVFISERDGLFGR